MFLGSINKRRRFTLVEGLCTAIVVALLSSAILSTLHISKIEAANSRHKERAVQILNAVADSYRFKPFDHLAIGQEQETGFLYEYVNPQSNGYDYVVDIIISNKAPDVKEISFHLQYFFLRQRIISETTIRTSRI